MEVEMKIKRYMAPSMRAALAQVRAEQGPDAVILSSRRVEEGIEVIAAVDYDEALFVDATLRRAAAAPEAQEIPSSAPDAAVAAPARAQKAATVARQATVAPAESAIRTPRESAVAPASKPAVQVPQASVAVPSAMPATARASVPTLMPDHAP